ncbi:hypothetical protein G173_gp029 [Erwinia phage phiEaH2]|uniref:Uncharacterized protein n=1 Tax=Erwinia phage phiEaH2 TaxID=1029988 RepID=J7KDW8_9CAUD|nr:hypothetical protein G173_gp029 [Erwinia phage phiEaH2]AFQ96574.1 hypothetical protein [Erwinia phage phiEaH2]
MNVYDVYADNDDQKSVTFAGKLTRLEKVRESIQGMRPLDEDSHWLVVTNSGTVQLYFRGTVNGGVLYLYELHSLCAEPMFTAWRSLMRQLEVKHIDLSVRHDDRSHVHLYEQLGFECVSQRVEITVTADAVFEPDSNVVGIENLSIEQTGELCTLIRARAVTDKAAEELLGELAMGFISGVVLLTDNHVGACLLYKEFPKMLVGEQCFCVMATTDPDYGHVFGLCYAGLMLLGQRTQKKINLGFAADYHPTAQEGVVYRPVTHHYSLR